MKVYLFWRQGYYDDPDTLLSVHATLASAQGRVQETMAPRPIAFKQTLPGFWDVENTSLYIEGREVEGS